MPRLLTWAVVRMLPFTDREDRGICLEGRKQREERGHFGSQQCAKKSAKIRGEAWAFGDSGLDLREWFKIGIHI